MNSKSVLRALANAYFEGANSDCNLKNILAHKNVNDLKGARPIVLMDEIPWEEMNLNDELTLKCEEPFLRELEWFFRTELYKWRHMRGDMVLQPFVGIEKIVSSTGMGINIQYEDLDMGQNKTVQAHTYVDQFQTIDDLDKLHMEQITYHKEETLKRFDIACELFGDIMPVQITGLHSGYGTACKIWDDISMFKNLNNMLIGMLDEPELMHELAGKLTDILIDKYRQFDEMELWNGNSYYNHCTAALSNDLQVNYENPTRKNVWGRGLAQILSTVSPAMHDEFDITYQIKALKDFPMVYYGCCEPLHQKIEILEKIPNLRKISITPWADVDAAAEIMGNKYVVAAKPNPAHFATKQLDEGAVRKELEKIVVACNRNGCSCDIVLKDITTVQNRPENLFRWCEIAMEVVKGNV